MTLAVALALALALALSAPAAATNRYATPVDADTTRRASVSIVLPVATTPDGALLEATPGASCAQLKCGALTPVSDHYLYAPNASAVGFGGCVDRCGYTVVGGGVQEDATITINIGMPRHTQSRAG
jgi:hypothetical protein